jgi:uroporphyrinogen decarboxylase
MAPNYIKIVKFAKAHNIPVVSVDTDGNVNTLLPLFNECGINLVLPFEVQAGCDIVEYKKKYPRICIHGGIDKNKIALGQKEIDNELDRIGELFELSGYIPSLDHLIPPDISYKDFTYFIKKLKERIF